MAAPTTSASPSYSQLLTDFVRAELISTLRAGLPHLPAGAVDYSGYSIGNNDTYILGAVPDMAINLQALAEGVTPAAEELLSDINTWTAAEIGRVVTGTDRLIRQQPSNWAGVVAERVAWSAAEHADEVARGIWDAATPIGVIGTGCEPPRIGSFLSAATLLQEKDVPTIGGYYYVITHPRVLNALQQQTGEMGWTDAAKFQTPNDLRSGILAEFRGLKFIGNSRVDTTDDKCFSHVIGANSLAFSDAGSITTHITMPTPSISDPLAQRFAAGWRGRWGGVALVRKLRQGDVTGVTSFADVHTTAPVPTFATN